MATTRSSTRSATTGSSRTPSPDPAPAPGGGGGGGGRPSGGPGPGPVAPAPVIQFARTPGELAAGQIIDYSTKEGRANFKFATKELSNVKFDGKSGSINSFHEKLLRRAEECGWNQGAGDIITVNGENSIQHYGRISVDQIRAHAAIYMDNSSRQTQNNDQFYRCIMNSLTEECSNKVINMPSEYTIVIGYQSFKSAILLYKALMQKAIVHTRATASNFRTNLSSLDTYMPLVNSNIEKFSQYVSDCVTGLEARGERSEDLLDNLFKGYKVATDAKFVSYIEQKETEYFDGAHITSDSLMQLAENKYAARVVRGEWGGKSEEQNQIIALSSTVTSLQNSLKLKQQTKKKNDKPKGKGKPKKSNIKNDSKWAWKDIAPKNGEKTKKFSGKTYYWCPHHKAWTLHKPEECNKRSTGSDSNDSTASSAKTDNDHNTNNVSFASSVTQIMEELEE